MRLRILLPIALALSTWLLPAVRAGSPQLPTGLATSRLVIPAAATVDGIAIDELSGLAWDARARCLHAVSDRGVLYRFRITFDDAALISVEPLRASVLPDDPATGKAFNAEGLTLRHAADGGSGGVELIIPVEGVPARILRLGVDGSESGEMAIPPALAAMLSGGKKNQGMEAVSISPSHGLIAAAESPLPGQRADRHTLYADGHYWTFPRHSPDSRLKGMDLLPDGTLLVLERNRGPLKGSTMASLSRVNLRGCAEDGDCQVETLVELTPGPSNFEGMTLLDARRVLLASDNGGKAKADTVLVLVRLP